MNKDNMIARMEELLKTDFQPLLEVAKDRSRDYEENCSMYEEGDEGNESYYRRGFGEDLEKVVEVLTELSEIKKESTPKELFITKTVPEDAVILLVDVQEHFFKEVPGSQEVIKRQEQRLEQMAEYLNELKSKGHKVYSIQDDSGIHPKLDGIPDVILPPWDYSMKPNDYRDAVSYYTIHPDIVDAMKNISTVIVGGLWLEICSYAVTRLLTNEGINAILSADPRLSLENALQWEKDDDDIITLEGECERDGVTIHDIDPS